MLTILTIPKPFEGSIGDIQRNAIASWQELGPDVQVILVGDDAGVEEAARDAGVEHVGGIARNERGTPRLDSAFALAANVARSPLWCFANADIVLLDDFATGIRRVSRAFDSFVMIGECRDLALGAGVRLDDPAVREQVRRRALAEGRLRGWAALDYFVFPRGLFDPLPPFLIGRACFDNWLVWRARDRRRAVVDATRAVVAVHQSHDYSHVPGGVEEAYYGEEARYNEKLAGGRAHIYSLHDATHRLYRMGPPVRYVLSIGRMRENARVFNASRDARKRAQEGGTARTRLLAVLPRPSKATAPLFDRLEPRKDMRVTVLYGEPDDTVTSLGHTHYFPRSLRVPRAPEYPINWAIWNSFRGLTPHCMVISGWSAFVTQSAIAWCRARRIPYLLLLEPGDKAKRASLNFLGRAAIRGATTVVVSNDATDQWLLEHGVRPGAIRRLHTNPDQAASTLADLAVAARSSRPRRQTISGRMRRLFADLR